MKRVIALLCLLSAPAFAQSSLIGTGLRLKPVSSAPPAFAVGACEPVGTPCVGWWTPASGGNADLPLWRKADGTDLPIVGAGTVTSIGMTVPSFLSVSGTPITNSGTFAISLALQASNMVLASNTSTGSGTPAFRLLVAADIPAIPESGVTSLVSDLALKAPLLSPAFTGSPTFPAGSIADAALATAPTKTSVANTWTKNQTITTFTLTDAATITVDLSERDSQRVTLGGNRTIALSNLASGSAVMLELIQDGTGSRTITWPAAIHWSSGTAPTLTTTAGQADVISCKSFNGTTMLCATNGNFAP